MVKCQLESVLDEDFMFKRFFSKTSAPPEKEQDSSKKGWYQQLSQGLSKTRRQLSQGIHALAGRSHLDQASIDTIENHLLQADMGLAVTEQVIEWLKKQRGEEPLWQNVQQYLYELLKPCEQPLIFEKSPRPFVMLVVGINGVGKTTTIGKMANHFKEQGLTLGLAAGDTFRAAAVEQLQTWGERSGLPVIGQTTGADSAAVIFDAVHSAQAKSWDLVIADTAGRLHTQGHLMQELQKIERVIKKFDPSAPHEVMLVLDASIGQNALSQVEKFQECVNVTSLALTKLDGTAKGGVIFAIAERFKLPIRFVGVGEGMKDLQIFNAKAFVQALCEVI